MTQRSQKSGKDSVTPVVTLCSALSSGHLCVYYAYTELTPVLYYFLIAILLYIYMARYNSEVSYFQVKIDFVI